MTPLKLIAKIICLPMRFDVWMAKFWLAVSDFAQKRLDNILNQYE